MPVWQLTKAGRFYERGGQTWVFPSNRTRISACEQALPEDTLRACASYRTHAQRFLEDVRDHGDIDQIAKWVKERRARGFH